MGTIWIVQDGLTHAPQTLDLFEEQFLIACAGILHGAFEAADTIVDLAYLTVGPLLKVQLAAHFFEEGGAHPQVFGHFRDGHVKALTKNFIRNSF